MEQLLILLVAGLFALLTVIVERFQERSGHSDRPNGAAGAPVPKPAKPEESTEERMRRFMEALGIPPEAPPPPPIQRRVEQKGAPTAAPPVAPRPRVPAEKAAARMPSPVTIEPEPDRGEPKPSLYREQRGKDSVPARPASAYMAGAVMPSAEEAVFSLPWSEAGAFHPSEVRELLRGADSLRIAVIAREILGPPRGLQSTF